MASTRTACQTVRSFKRYTTSQQRQSWTCCGCGTHVHPTAGTIYHKSATSLHLWFYAMYLITSTRCGISAKQMERELGVNYKTALRMMRLIRTDLMTQDDDEPMLSGTVEMDETYVGGTRRGDPVGRPVPGKTHKVAVFGMFAVFSRFLRKSPRFGIGISLPSGVRCVGSLSLLMI